MYEDPMLQIDVAAQLDAVEMNRFSPVEAHYIGHAAAGNTVEVGEIKDRPPEAAAREVATEMWHSYTPFNAENTPMYGSDAERMEAVRTVRELAAQASLTGKYFDGQHRRLAKDLEAGKISQDEHDQAVGAIMTGMALTKPAHLRQVGEAQRAAIERRVKAGALPPETRFADVVSRKTENGVELAGIDAVVAKMTGAGSQAELAASGLALKKQFYTGDNLVKATARHDKQQAMLAAQGDLEAEMRRTFDLILEEEAAKAKKDTSNDD